MIARWKALPPRLRARLLQMAATVALWLILLLGIAALARKYGPRLGLW